MTEHKPAHIEGAGSGSVRNYVTGFVLSVVLTLIAYAFVSRHVSSDHELYSHRFLIFIIATLGISQLIVQLFFFLHLGDESKPRWNLLVFSFMLIVVIILVFGSLWIMYYLNYHMPSTNQVNQYIRSQDGL
jgi:cytochrome o ubiquinol oxidase operon protein cyoD